MAAAAARVVFMAISSINDSGQEKISCLHCPRNYGVPAVETIAKKAHRPESGLYRRLRAARRKPLGRGGSAGATSNATAARASLPLDASNQNSDCADRDRTRIPEIRKRRSDGAQADRK